MPRKIYAATAYQNLDDFVYGSSKYPVVLKNGLSIGGGKVYPEVNFTLPPMLIELQTLPDVLQNYREIIAGICDRAVALEVPGFVAEIETLPPMTFHPEWGIEVTKIVVDTIKECENKHGINGVVRITPNDIREGRELEHMWHGRHWDAMFETFEGCAKVGADLLAVESVGGKEVHDDAIINCDLDKSLFALSVLGCRDMEKLWTEIVAVADRTGTIASGDTACGFGNSAMVLADRGFIPKVFAAIVRVMTVARSLVALECGARGPHKDCGYEGVFIKAITGTPITTEGRVAACAHLSPVGNVAACLCDLWSNESIQNIKLLGGAAPTVSFEQLVFDCRLMNQAIEKGKDAVLFLRDLNADSDSALDPQAYVLRPDIVLDISKKLVSLDGDYNRTKYGAVYAAEAIRDGVENGRLKLSRREKSWLDRLQSQIDEFPDTADELTARVISSCDKLDPKKYDL